MPDLLEGALRLLKQSELERKEIYVFTDLTEGLGHRHARSVCTAVCRVARPGGVCDRRGRARPARSVAGRGCSYPARYSAQNSPLHVVSELDSLAMAGDGVVEMYLSDNEGQMQKRSEQIVDYTPGSRTKRWISRSAGLDVGAHQGYVRIIGEDSLPIDNRAYFSVEVKPPWSVLVVAEPPADYHAANFVEAWRRPTSVAVAMPVTTARSSILPSLDGDRSNPMRPCACSIRRRWSRAPGGSWPTMLAAAAAWEYSLAPTSSSSSPASMPRPRRSCCRARWNSSPAFPRGPIISARGMTSIRSWPSFAAQPRLGPLGRISGVSLLAIPELQDGVGTVMSMAGGQPALLEKPLGKGRRAVVRHAGVGVGRSCRG